MFEIGFIILYHTLIAIVIPVGTIFKEIVFSKFIIYTVDFTKGVVNVSFLV